MQQSLIVRRIGTVKIGLFSHRRYVERFGLPATPEELPRRCWIGFDRDDHSFRSVGPSALNVRREMFGFRCDGDMAQMAALRAGIGIGGCQVNLARRNPDLVPVLADTLMRAGKAWQYHQGGRPVSPLSVLRRCACRDQICAKTRNQAPALAGIAAEPQANKGRRDTTAVEAARELPAARGA
jgi:hypothetical protein